MELTPTLREQLHAKLKDKWSNDKRCEICGSTQWIIPEKIFELREYHGAKNIFIGKGVVIPLVLLSCSTCGNTKLLSAVAIGIIDPKTGELTDG